MQTMSTHWNPYFVAYAREHGNAPDAQLEADRAIYPGGHMAGYIAWINDRWAEFRKANGCKAECTIDHSAQFSTWLNDR